MSRKTQRYSKEFKAEAVRTVPENQLSISEGASRLSLPEGTLGQWVTAARKGLGTPGSRTVAELESEILQLLKRCVRYLVYPGAVITTGYSMNPQTENFFW
ncbi:IS600 ORF1 [Shigella sonnei]|uniref:IS600 ORF1 n=1 Tax=Shigella sonnei TaxID=624 RepID=A0A8B4LL43_SHISO|nr:IS600 ORF1 [Shigella sonnei]SRU50033.1 IS600 ORF1 [Shigella sonnei]SRX31379.1 IS600 ORF1 [Shigella sonnei]SVG67449.1 IS600 ORF1 [Shigella sonnei]